MKACSAVFRFAPSPNGRLHLGHAYSALLNDRMAREAGGRFLVRIEDIDQERCKPELVDACIADLNWLGLSFETPLRQSTRMPAYREAIAQLMGQGLLYVCTCSRKRIAQAATGAQDPERQPLYPGTCRPMAHRFDWDSVLRLDMARAIAKVHALSWIEKGVRVSADPSVWGDVILARKGIGTSYHLAVVVDDAFQRVTDIVRGEDLYAQTAIHRLLQVLLGLPEPRYHHHGLITHDSGRKLAKSRADQSLAELRQLGATPESIRSRLGF